MHRKYFSERKGRREGGIIFLKAGSLSIGGSAMILFCTRIQAGGQRSKKLTANSCPSCLCPGRGMADLSCRQEVRMRGLSKS